MKDAKLLIQWPKITNICPYSEGEIKPQLKPRGSVANEEEPKPSHQLYKLQIKSTQSTRQTLSMDYTESH